MIYGTTWRLLPFFFLLHLWKIALNKVLKTVDDLLCGVPINQRGDEFTSHMALACK